MAVNMDSTPKSYSSSSFAQPSSINRPISAQHASDVTSFSFNPQCTSNSPASIYSNLISSSTTYGSTFKTDCPTSYPSYRPSAQFMASLKFDSGTSHKYYAPVNTYDESYSDAMYASIPPRAFLSMISNRTWDNKPIVDKEKKDEIVVKKKDNDNINTNKQQVVPRVSRSATNRSESNPDLNNNFLKDRHGLYKMCPPQWCDFHKCDRITILAQPKRLPCEYKENRRSVYWITKRPPPRHGNFTEFETTPRLDELAQPKVVSSTRHCDWEGDYAWPPPSTRDPRTVNWDRLACPKTVYPPNACPIQHVKRSALKGRCSKRVKALAKPLARKMDAITIRQSE